MKVFNNHKGNTLPLVLIVLSIMTIFGIVTLSMTSSQTKFNIIDDASQKLLSMQKQAITSIYGI